MKLFFVVLVISVVITALTDAAAAQDEAPLVMPGTEAPESHVSAETSECFVFARYVIKTAPSEDGGSNISVYKRGHARDACLAEGEPWLYAPDSDNNSFFGLSGKYLFVDMGTSAGSRDLEVYDLEARRSLLTQSYNGDLRLTDGRLLIFDEPSDKKGAPGTCKDAAKWKRQGGSVGWVQGKKLDLDSQKTVNAGALRCVYVE
jgi:hypothetical protein